MIHGTAVNYRKRGCRCDACREANTRAQNIYRLRLLHGEQITVDATGSRRRLQALVALGWPIHLEDRLSPHARRLTYSGQRTVHADTAAAVRALYDELSMTPGPSSRSRQRAARKGWPVPLAWSDDSIDDPNARPADWRRSDDQRRPMEHVIEDWHDTWDYHHGDLTIGAARLGMTRDALAQHLVRAARAGIDVRRQEEDAA